MIDLIHSLESKLRFGEKPNTYQDILSLPLDKVLPWVNKKDYQQAGLKPPTVGQARMVHLVTIGKDIPQEILSYCAKLDPNNIFSEYAETWNAIALKKGLSELTVKEFVRKLSSGLNKALNNSDTLTDYYGQSLTSGVKWIEEARVASQR